MDFAEIIKSSITVSELLSSYGIQVRGGKASCPFHRERTPSFVINKNDRAWKCYGCGEGGTVIDFVMKYEGISFRQSLVRLGGMFGISVPALGCKERRELFLRKEEKRRERERLQKCIENTEEQYISAVKSLCECEEIIKHGMKSGEVSEEFFDALSRIDRLRYEADFWEEKRGEIYGKRTCDTRLDA